MKEHKHLIYATVMNIAGIIISLVFSQTYPRGLNITLIFFVIFIIQAILVSFLWFCTLNNLSAFLVRLAVMLLIVINSLMIFFVLIFIDSFIASIITPLFAVILIFSASVLYLRHSMKM